MNDDSLEQRFWRFVERGDEDECWLWQGWKSHSNTGYGRFTFHDKKYSAHRVSYELYRGKIPKGLLVCHTCDVRACVNPNHFFLGTHTDNALDMVAKGRRSYSSFGGKNRKLTDQQVIWTYVTKGKITSKTLASVFNVHISAIKKIREGSTHKKLIRDWKEKGLAANATSP